MSIGSSPLARGTRGNGHQACALERFIPAGAGNTAASSARARASAVHPRWRGEHLDPEERAELRPGSSPLARGTLMAFALDTTHPRFIPAGAGNTRSATTTLRKWTVHPRWRGEHDGVAASVASLIGSSPLARGTPAYVVVQLSRARFIPAGAGNTASSFTHTSTTPVHPRWRGEHGPSFSDLVQAYGSSPLARGTPGAATRQPKCIRFIPAGAGNTSRGCRGPPGCAVHPRWRGEHYTRGAPNERLIGSSPLARGTHELVRVLNALLRFIPAGAGNTRPQLPQPR